jgi:hypothetical protein
MCPELGADQRFGRGQAEWRKLDIVGAQDRGFQIDERPEAYVKIDRDDGEFLELVGRSLRKRFFRRRAAPAVERRIARSKRPSL